MNKFVGIKNNVVMVWTDQLYKREKNFNYSQTYHIQTSEQQMKAIIGYG